MDHEGRFGKLSWQGGGKGWHIYVDGRARRWKRVRKSVSHVNRNWGSHEVWPLLNFENWHTHLLFFKIIAYTHKVKKMFLDWFVIKLSISFLGEAEQWVHSCDISTWYIERLDVLKDLMHWKTWYIERLDALKDLIHWKTWYIEPNQPNEIQ